MSLNEPKVPRYSDEVMSTRLQLSQLIDVYAELQRGVVGQVRTLASQISAATPGKFLLLQFSMSQVTQIGDSIGNLISTVNASIANSIRNQKA